jgi:hypothetical protein
MYLRFDQWGCPRKLNPEDKTDMRSVIMKFVILLSVLVSAFISSVTVSAQDKDVENQKAPVYYSFSYAPFYQFETDLEGSGKFNVSRHFFRFDVLRTINRHLRIGLGLAYDFENWDFEGVANVAGATPWSKIHRPGISLPIIYALSADWQLGFTPAIEFSGESGAEPDEAFTYGGVFSLMHPVNKKLLLGIGFGVFDRLEKLEVFPFIVINWKINEQFRISNPLRAGPSGPAGLELVYSPWEKWEFGIGSAYRSYRFRLDDKSAVANGIGEVDSLVTFVRVDRKLGANLNIGLFGGALFDGELSIEDAQGDDLASVTYDPAPFLALTFTGRF